MQIKGMAAIVTGGASGLGAATAALLAEQGAKVTLFDINAEKGTVVADALGGLFQQVDVTSDASVEAGLSAARARHGQERILVNCAGSGRAIKTAARNRTTGASEAYPMDDFIRTITLNLIGTFRCVTLSAAGMMTLPPLDDGERGAIVNTASVAAEDGQIGQVAYAASKAAIVGMTLPIARDLSSEGIRINTILPGIFDTPLLRRAPDSVKESLGASVPFPKRLGMPAEFADLVLMMLRNSYINGEDVRLDGAIRMAPR